MTNQTGYIVYATDSVGTALGEIEPGAIRLLGEPGDGHVTAVEHIPFGHKFALRALRAGDPVIKYGARIGTSARPRRTSFPVSMCICITCAATLTSAPQR